MPDSTESPASPAPEPQYRYVTVPPVSVRLTVGALVGQLPPGVWSGTESDKAREVALPTAEILETRFPRIRLDRLRDLLPGCIEVPHGAPEWIALPTYHVALAYRPEMRREDLDSTPAPAVSSERTPVPSWKRIAKPRLAPAPPPAQAPTATGGSTAESPSLGGIIITGDGEARLREAFATNEPLTIERLVALASHLPGLRGCSLSRGNETVTSPGVISASDLRNLGARVSDLLAGISSSSGLRLLPEVTLHAESGPISILQRGPLVLIALHAEHAFPPGVREKFETLLECLERALG
ncbi:MAG TPA: hypothetical protein VIM48_10840 [Chthoniobacterales bacterium]